MFNINYNKEESKALIILNDIDAKYIATLKNIISILPQDCTVDNINWFKPNASISRDDIPLIIHSNNPLKLSHTLANYLFQDLKFDMVRSTTVMPYQEFLIYLDNRRFIHMFRYPIIKRIKTQCIFNPVKIKIDNIKINILSIESTLENVFHNLYRPDPTKWDVKQFKSILNLYIDDIKIDLDDVIEVSGGRSHKISYPKLIYESLKGQEQNYILIGIWAIYALNLTNEPINDKIQLISDVHPDSIVDMIKGVIRHDANITYKIEQVGLLYDHWTTRCIFYINEGGKRRAILDIFNSTSWELVPFIRHNSIELGNPFVLCRFILIDLWVITVLNKMSVINDEHFATLKQKTKINLKLVLKYSIQDTVFGKDYYGIYNDLVKIKKKLVQTESQNSNKIFYPYIPYDYIKQNGTLKIIGGAGEESNEFDVLNEFLEPVTVYSGLSL